MLHYKRAINPMKKFISSDRLFNIIFVVGAVLVYNFDDRFADRSEVPADTQDCNEVIAERTLLSSDQRLSYGIAFGLGQRMEADGVPLDTGAFTAGLSDALSGSEPRLTEEEIAAELQAYQETAAAEMAASQTEAGAVNGAVSAAFLTANAVKEGVVVTESGLQYEIITEGTGPMPGPNDQVEVHYRGTLVDGTVFDSSIDRGETVTFGVSQVIPGWTEALQLMPTGSKWLLAIPADLAYGAGGAGEVIGPDAALIFEVELIAIPGNKDQDKQLNDVSGQPDPAGVSATPTPSPSIAANSLAAGVEQPGEAIAYDAAYALVQERQFDKAIPAFQQFLQRFPDGLYAANAHYWLGEMYSWEEPPDLIANDCTAPPPPKIPDGTTASMEQMLAAQKAVEDFQSANTEYRACLDPLVTAAEVAAAGDSHGTELQKTLEQLNNDYNTSVWTEEKLANGFNVALRDFKEANPADSN
jgi:FKBP-type peptidyl-prolyl cis-trans isomerase